MITAWLDDIELSWEEPPTPTPVHMSWACSAAELTLTSTPIQFRVPNLAPSTCTSPSMLVLMPLVT